MPDFIFTYHITSDCTLKCSPAHDRVCNSCAGLQKGHGVPGDLMQKVLDVSREFFMLPDEEKLTIKMSSSSHFRYSIIFKSATSIV